MIVPRFGASEADPAPREWPEARPQYDSLTAAAAGETARWNVPGLAVAILNNGEIETASAGFASLATKQPVTDDTIFQIGSISKVFTTTLVMQLVDDGKIDLDEPVLTYVPDLPLADKAVRKSVTMRHLLSHSSGFDGDRFIDYGRGDDALEKGIASYGSVPQWYQPDALFAYNNNAFNLAGRVVELVSGQPFETVMRERLLDPLGLETAAYFAEDVIATPHAIGHNLPDRATGNQVVRKYALPRWVNPAGGIVASTRELLRFAQLHIDNGKFGGKRLLSAKSARAMRKPRIDAGPAWGKYGLGWLEKTAKPFQIVGHGGATNGFRAQLTVVPEKGFAIAVLTNGSSGGKAQSEIEKWALEKYFEFSYPTHERVELDADALATLSGVYTRHDGRFTLRPEGTLMAAEYVEINEETGEEVETHLAVAEPISPTWLRMLNGPWKDAIAEVLQVQEGEQERQFLRLSGRLAEQTADADADAKPGKKKSGKGKGKSGKKR